MWVAVAQRDELAPGSILKVQANGETLALIRDVEKFYAVLNSCPHEGASLAEGSVTGDCLTCPLHHYKYDFKTGNCLTDPKLCLRTFPAKLEQGKVWLDLPVPAALVKSPEDLSKKISAVENWKREKHGLDGWEDILRHAREQTAMAKLSDIELERMKWFGFFHRKNNDPDHYMIRVRIPACEMSSEQARTLAYIAYDSGYSILDVTTRGNVQIQGLTIGKLPGVRAALDKVGLTALQTGHDNVRNVTSNPWSGIDPDELIDTRELAQNITGLILGNREFSDLPRKFNIALTGRQDPHAHAWTQDISFVAGRGPGGKVGFQILLGGSQGQSTRLASHLPVFIPPEQVVDVTAATLRTFRELGYRHNRHQVRFRYLMERIGIEQTRLEIEKRLGQSLLAWSKPAPLPSGEENFIGWFRQKQQDLWAVGVCVPVGRLSWEQMEGLAVMAQQYGDGGLRVTYDQNLILTGIPTTRKQVVAYAIARHGLTFEPDSITRNTVACTGKQFCNLAVTETKGYAFQLIEELRRRKVQLHGINLHMSGCPNSCGMSMTADIGLRGARVRRGLRILDAFDVILGGGFGPSVEMGILYKKLVPTTELPDLIAQVVGDFYLHRSENDTFSQYWRSKLSNHKADQPQDALPEWHCDRCGHKHIASAPPMFCPICSALRSQFHRVEEESQAVGVAS